MASSSSSMERAARNDRQKRRLERIGVLAARKIGIEMSVGVLNLWRSGSAGRRRIPDFVLEAMFPLIELIAEANTAAHLTGASIALNDALPVIDRLRSVAFGPYENSIDVAVARMNLTADQVAAIAAEYGEDAINVVRGAAEPIQIRLRKAVATAIERNITVPEGAAILRDALIKAGVTVPRAAALQPHLFETMFRTQTSISYSAGRWQMNQQPIVQEVLWGYEYVTAGDDRVRASHDLLDGVSLPKESPRWSTIYPPNGFNCVTPCTAMTYAGGTKRADEVEVGDLLLTGRGRYRPVLQVHRSEAPKEVYSLDLDGITLRATPEHVVATRRGWIEVASLEEGDELLNIQHVSLGDIPSRDIEDPAHQRARHEAGVSRGSFSLTSAELDDSFCGGQVEVSPQGADVLVEDRAKSITLQQAEHDELMVSQADEGIWMERRIEAKAFTMCFSHFLSYFRPSCRSRGAELFTRLLSAVQINPMMQSVGLAATTEFYALAGHDVAGGPESDAGHFIQLRQKHFASFVSVDEIFKAARPFFVDEGDVSVEISFRTAWLDAHDVSRSFNVLPVNVDARWVKVKRAPVLFATSEVYTFSVAEDASYVADGIVSHNCRCDAIEIYKDEEDLAVINDVPPAQEVDGIFTEPVPDPGFAFNPGNVVSAQIPGTIGPLAGL